MKWIAPQALLLVLGTFILMSQHSTGTRVGDFSAMSGDGIVIRESDIKGKVTVLFYMTKDTKETNRKAQDQLKEKYLAMDSKNRGKIIRLPIVDCSGASWPFKGIWEDQLVKNSEIEGCMVFGDWDGSIKKQFSFNDNEVYVLIIDQKGIIRFSKEGEMSQTDIDRAKELLDTLLQP
jgi:predicted transcriptional regulator